MRPNFRAMGLGLILSGTFSAVLGAGAGAWGSVVLQLGLVGLGLILRMDRRVLRNLVV